MTLIRRLTAADVGRYRELRCQALTETPLLFIESLEDFEQLATDAIVSRLSSPSRFVLGAFADNGDLLGVIGFRRETAARLAHIGYLLELYVAPGARGFRLGQLLVSMLLDEGREIAGVEQLKVQLEASNSRAQALYEAFGFQTWGIEPRAVRVGDVVSDDCHMILFL